MKTIVLLVSFVLASLASGARVTYPGLPAYQSSTYYNAGTYLGPDRALDRDKDYDFPSGHLDKCTHTNKELNPWWAVDLQKPYSINSVKIIIRKGFEFRLANFTVGVSNSHPMQVAPVPGQYDVCWKYVGTPPAGLITLNCSQSLQKSRFVIIQLPTNQYLELCEVEIYVTDYNILTPTLFTYQNSTYVYRRRPLYSFYGIDQNYQVVFPDPDQHACSHTQSEQHSWWAVDLNLPYNIKSVTVYFRKELKSRAAGAMVGVTNSSVLYVLPDPGNLNVCGYLPNAAFLNSLQQDSYTVRCQLNMPAAKFLVIQLPGQNYLELCEVEVTADHA